MKSKSMEVVSIFANTLDEAWFNVIEGLFRLEETGIGINSYKIDQGSFTGSNRLEYDFAVIQINYPGTRPLAPVVPEGIPAPTTDDSIELYFQRYLLSDYKEKDEQYTYGERIMMSINQVIKKIKEGPNSNQIILQVAEPLDILLEDPPCLRHIDIRIKNGTIHFFPYFRSWDAFAGFPENMGGIQRLKEHIGEKCGLRDGKIIASSKGLHLYSHQIDVAKLRVGRSKRGDKKTIAETD